MTHAFILKRFYFYSTTQRVIGVNVLTLALAEQTGLSVGSDAGTYAVHVHYIAHPVIGGFKESN